MKMNIIKILPCGISKTIYKTDSFFEKIFKKNILIFGKNKFKQKIIVDYLVKNYFTFKSLFFFDKKNNNQLFIKNIIKRKSVNSYNFNYFKIIFSRKEKNHLVFLKIINSKLSNWSKFKKNKFIVILYNISKLNKTKQKKLFQIVNKYLDYFFFIFTCSSLKKTINNIKDKTFCFPILEWTFFCKKKKNMLNTENCIGWLRQKKNKNMENICLKLKLLILTSIANYYKTFYFLVDFWKTFFFSHVRNSNKHIISKSNTIKIPAEYCSLKILLKKVFTFSNLYQNKYFLLKIHLPITWKKTTHLITLFIYNFFLKKTPKFYFN
jgi:hypothetical protein